MKLKPLAGVLFFVAVFIAGYYNALLSHKPRVCTSGDEHLLPNTRERLFPNTPELSPIQNQSDCSANLHHLRSAPPPLDFQWLALNHHAVDVNLVGLDGAPVPLETVGTLTLLNQTIYRFANNVSGTFRLSASDQAISHFDLHPADCSCPKSLTHFLTQYSCPADLEPRVKNSMVRWPSNSITEEMMADNRWHLHSLPHVLELAIFSNKLYCRRQNGQQCPPPTGSSASAWRISKVVWLIHALLRKVELPDLVFFYNIDDRPLMMHYSFQPVFSPSGTDFHGDLLLPTGYLILEKFHGYDVINSAWGRPWEGRADVAYFVGRMTGEPLPSLEGIHVLNPRLRAAEIATERPDLLNVTVTIDGILPPDDPIVAPLLARGVVQEGFLENREGDVKYVVDLPGNSASWRLGARFGEGGVTLKSQTPWNEYWHYLLEHKTNVLLVGDWLDDLVEQLEAARAHDAEMRCVARAAQLLSLTRLRQEDLLCWTALSFAHLATKMKFSPKLTDEFVEIPMDNRDSSMCTCV